MTPSVGGWPAPLARFNNLASSASEIALRIDLAAADLSAFYAVGNLRIPRPGKWQEDDFIFDIGAQKSVVCGGLALELGLDLYGETVKVETVRGVVRVKESWFRINIGLDWVLLPCWVPWPVERATDADENLLGLAGLMEKYDILLTKEEVLFYRRGGLPVRP